MGIDERLKKFEDDFNEIERTEEVPIITEPERTKGIQQSDTKIDELERTEEVPKIPKHVDLERTEEVPKYVAVEKSKKVPLDEREEPKVDYVQKKSINVYCNNSSVDFGYKDVDPNEETRVIEEIIPEISDIAVKVEEPVKKSPLIEKVKKFIGMKSRSVHSIEEDVAEIRKAQERMKKAKQQYDNNGKKESKLSTDRGSDVCYIDLRIESRRYIRKK